MKVVFALGLAVLLASLGCASGNGSQSGGDASTPGSVSIESGHAPVNGIRMYYEVHGRPDGVPLVLLHGGGSTIDVTFGRVNPDPQQLKTMHDKDAARMQGFTDVPESQVRAVRAPTLIVLGDRDIVKLEHAVELTRLISGARLLVLPGGHGDHLGEAVVTHAESRMPELTAQLIEEFLGAPRGADRSPRRGISAGSSAPRRPSSSSP